MPSQALQRQKEGLTESNASTRKSTGASVTSAAGAVVTGTSAKAAQEATRVLLRLKVGMGSWGVVHVSCSCEGLAKARLLSVSRQ